RCATRYVITRVLPLPAPARINTGPSVAYTASSCCGLRSFAKSKLLFYRNALRQISRLIDIAAATNCNVVGQQLQRNHLKNGEKQFVGGGNAEVVIGILPELRVILISDRDNDSITRLHFLHIV